MRIMTLSKMRLGLRYLTLLPATAKPHLFCLSTRSRPARIDRSNRPRSALVLMETSKPELIVVNMIEDDSRVRLIQSDTIVL